MREAAAHDGQLLIVHAYNPVMPVSEPALFAVPDIQHFHEAAQRVLDAEVDYLKGLGTGVPIDSRLECGPAVDALLDIGRDADVMVVGSRGVGRMRGLFLGSVSQAVIARASCPVLVVPTRERERGSPVPLQPTALEAAQG